MSLYANINARKKAGTSRSKENSTISDKNYADMKAGFPNSKKNRGAYLKKKKFKPHTMYDKNGKPYKANTMQEHLDMKKKGYSHKKKKGAYMNALKKKAGYYVGKKLTPRELKNFQKRDEESKTHPRFSGAKDIRRSSNYDVKTGEPATSKQYMEGRLLKRKRLKRGNKARGR